jgi:hypothetical protein
MDLVGRLYKYEEKEKTVYIQDMSESPFTAHLFAVDLLFFFFMNHFQILPSESPRPPFYYAVQIYNSLLS